MTEIESTGLTHPHLCLSRIPAGGSLQTSALLLPPGLRGQAEGGQEPGGRPPSGAGALLNSQETNQHYALKWPAALCSSILFVQSLGRSCRVHWEFGT